MRTIILFVIYILLVIILTPVLFLCLLLRARAPILAVGKWAIGLGRRVLGITVEVSGLENVDRRRAFIFMANHLSFLDGPLLFRLIPQPVRIILKKSIFRIPVVGIGMLHVGFVPVDRKSIRGGKKSIDRASRLMREKKYSFLVFPEGTRSRDGCLQPFRRGGFFLALESGVPIIPVSLTGTFELMPKGRFFAKRGKILVVFHPPVPVAGYTRATLPGLMAEVRNIILSGLPASP